MKLRRAGREKNRGTLRVLVNTLVGCNVTQSRAAYAVPMQGDAQRAAIILPSHAPLKICIAPYEIAAFFFLIAVTAPLPVRQRICRQ